MSNLNEDDDIDELLDDLLSDVDQSDEEGNINIRFEQEAPDNVEIDSLREGHNDSDKESVFDGPDDPLECNRQLLNFWLQLKEHTTILLYKVESKLSIIETRMKSRYLSNKQVLFYTPGIPYFKDRNHFSPFPNEDTVVKKARYEIHIDMLPKVSPWTASDRSNLLLSIKEEAISAVLQSQENVKPDNSTTRSKSKKSISERKKSNSSLPTDFKDMIGPLGARDFDWSHIANTRFHNKHSALDCSVMWNVYLHPDINKTGWKKSEDMKLKEIVQKNNYQNWDKICRDLGTNRSAYQCFIRYNSTKKVPEIRSCVWPPEEDNKLCRLVKAFQIGDCIQWREIATFMDDRTKQQVYFRWTYSLAPDLVKGRFTNEENKILIEGVKKYGPNFRKISIYLMPNRSAVQLNDHYQRLQPDGVKQQNTWTKEQDNTLLTLHKQFGAKWSQIARYFVGKTRTQVRHRHTALKKLLKKGALKAQRAAKSKGHQDTQNVVELEEQNSKDMINETHSDEIDLKLIEYFRSRNSDAVRDERSNEIYGTEQLQNHTQDLHNVLRLLDANLDIPDCLDNWPLSNRQKLLLSSLKQYNHQRNDKERQSKMMEQCAKHMFTSTPSSENNTNPAPTNSQGGRKRKKNLKDPCIIDYDLNKDSTFVVDTAEELETPDCVKNVIKEDNTIFIKLCRLLDSSYSSSSQGSLNNKLPRSSPNIRDTPNVIVNKSSEVQGNVVPNMFTASSVYNEQSFTLVSHVDKFADSTNEPTAIEPTLESLLALKNLLYMKNLSRWATENCEIQDFDDDGNKDEESTNNINSTESSQEYDKAYSLLERRITQLFKYPLGLSKTDLPNVPDICM